MKNDDNHSEKEIAERMKNALRKSLAMPPSPFTPKKKEKSKPKKVRLSPRVSSK